MGTWGHRTFENDAALDVVGDLEDEGAGLTAEILQRASADHLDAEDAAAVLAAAELVAAALGHGDDRLLPGVAEWLAAHRDEVSAAGAERARRAVVRVLEDSELRERWDAQGDSAWVADVHELLRRLG